MRPERFDGKPSTTESQWNHWLKTFENFLVISNATEVDKLGLLINHVSSTVYDHISDCSSYSSAIATLKSVYSKPVNKLMARYILATRKQASHETIEQFLNALKILAKECQFTSLSLAERTHEAILDAFVAGIASSSIRQRLLENSSLTLEQASSQAQSLDLAQKNATLYAAPTLTDLSASLLDQRETMSDANSSRENVASETLGAVRSKCFFCGNLYHPRNKCPAKEVTCFKCSKRGHFSKVCKSNVSEKRFTPSSKRPTTAGMQSLSDKDESCDSKSWLGYLAYASINHDTKAPSNLLMLATVNNCQISTMIDSGSSKSFLHSEVANSLGLKIYPSKEKILMATSNLATDTLGHTYIDIMLCGRSYKNYKVGVLPELCTNLILGRDFMNIHKSVEFNFKGSYPKLSLCAASLMNIDPPSLFSNLSPDCKPIRVPSRKFSSQDKFFISQEVKRLLKEGKIEKSTSPWRAQVLVAGGGNHKKRLVIDYSLTINRFTFLDAFPLPLINDLVQEMAKNKYYSKFDLKSAYHQIPISPEDRIYTAFEADGELYQFTVLPFGVTNAVAVFQREMEDFVRRRNLKKVYIYLDDIVVGGETLEEHDKNLELFLNACVLENITFNQDKCQHHLTEINYLGHCISYNTIKPDPSRFSSLANLAFPTDQKALQRCLGLFSYYSKWIPSYSDKVNVLLNVKVFPINSEQQKAFKLLINDICSASVAPIDESQPFEVETDASDVALGAALSQNGRPVAFFSRTLNMSEKLQPAVEKEAAAIIEAVRHWRHYLSCRRFVLTTDQEAVSFMFEKKKGTKIKNDKIMRWRLELSTYQYDINFRPGKKNLSADAISRSCSTNCHTIEDLKRLHHSLCHPGITRLMHFVRCKNLPFSMNEVKQVCLNCSVCAEIKPRFYKPPPFTLVRATRPFERISMDFIGPKPSCSKNKYLLVMIDEFSRFPFAFPCSDMTSKTVIECCHRVFSLFGCPSSLHTDRAQCFMSSELKEYTLRHGIILTHTTPYHPTGNSQCERLNGTLWKTVKLALKSENLSDTKWESVLPMVLHSIRSLLCVTTNATPHERIFQYSRKSVTGYSLPHWLIKPGPVLIRKHVRLNKNDPLVEQVELLESNPNFSKIRFPDGRETTVSTSDLADPAFKMAERTVNTNEETPLSKPDIDLPPSEEDVNTFEGFDSSVPTYELDCSKDFEQTCSPPHKLENKNTNVLRRSDRNRKAPDRLTYE